MNLVNPAMEALATKIGFLAAMIPATPTAMSAAPLPARNVNTGVVQGPIVNLTMDLINRLGSFNRKLVGLE